MSSFPSAFLRPALALGVLFGSTALAPVARAAHQTVAAEDLELSTPCIGRIDVNVDPAMSDGVSLDTSAASAAHVTIRTAKNESASRVIVASKSCAPSARLSVLIAPNVGVSIHDSHDTHFVLHGTVASVEASLEAGQLEADTVQSLDLSLRGTEQVQIAHLNRAAQIVASGSASLVVDHADLDALSAQLSDMTRLIITDGRFGALTLSSDGAAVATLGGTVETATVTANGTGLLTIPKVSGALARNGSGPLQVGPAAPAAPSPAQPAPVKPAPVQPAPAQPGPVQPAPAQPLPTQPLPAQPAPMSPTPAPATPPVVSAPSQPAPLPPVTATPGGAAPVAPRPATPAPVTPQVTATPPSTPDTTDTADDPMQTETPPTDQKNPATKRVDPDNAPEGATTDGAPDRATDGSTPVAPQASQGVRSGADRNTAGQTGRGETQPGQDTEGRQP